MKSAWSQIEREAQAAFVGRNRFPLPAYSELMPPPYVGIKPYAPLRSDASATAAADAASGLPITEYEQAHELEPGLAEVASKVLSEIAKLARGHAHELSRPMIEGNPAWPPVLAEAARAGRVDANGPVIALSLALSRTQDDKGNVRWTLFGASHHGPSRPFWRSFASDDGSRLAALVGWAHGGPPSLDGVRVLADVSELPTFARPLLLDESASLAGVRTLVTFRPFAQLPMGVQNAVLEGKLALFPSPASLLFFEHPGYRRLTRALPGAMQIPLLHLFPHVEGGYRLRIPQSGWLDEKVAPSHHGHRIVNRVARSHRWQRAARDATAACEFDDSVSVALFSTDPDDLGLYGKPMARNAQIWREDYGLLLDGPNATPLEIESAARAINAGGRFGYRFYYPPMRAGQRELYWHRPIVARLNANGAVQLADDQPRGYVEAAALGTEPAIELQPELLERPGHRQAARQLTRDPGVLRHTHMHNVRKLLDFRELIGAPLSPSLARALIHTARERTLGDWLAELPALGTESVRALVAEVQAAIGGVVDAGQALTVDHTGTREFEKRVWHSIAALSNGDFRSTDNADVVVTNQGKAGGRYAHVVGTAPHSRDLERLGDHLHQVHRELIAKHGMQGQACVLDHAFHWETDFAFPWSSGWLRNQARQAHERNIVIVIPGRRRDQAVIMGDHYDTAYMEDVFERERGGDGLRAAAAGADDNHSATTALLMAADVLLPMARAGRLERDVWLVHLTGEEFPSDCLGARALARAMIERQLRLFAEDGSLVDLSDVRVVGAFVLDMIAHNNLRDRDVFQIAPGEGAAAARLALRTHMANQRWNRAAVEWNRAADRRELARAQRCEDRAGPPPFAHLPLHGEVRVEWEPRSALYNTDGQIFSDVGIPVVLLMENYDISRSGYHDTHDTMKNIDLDYAAALTAIAIEAVADCACAGEI